MKGMTLVEILVSLVIVSLIVMISTLLMNVVGNFMRLSREFDEAFNEVNFSSRMVGVVQDVINRFGRHPDEITVSSNSITGKINVLSESVDAVFTVQGEETEDGYITRLILSAGGDERVLLEIPNASMTLSWATEVSGDVGAALRLIVERWSNVIPNGRVVRNFLVPLINVR